MVWRTVGIVLLVGLLGCGPEVYRPCPVEPVFAGDTEPMAIGLIEGWMDPRELPFTMPAVCAPRGSYDPERGNPCNRSPAPSRYPNRGVQFVGPHGEAKLAATSRLFQEPTMACGATPGVDYLRLVIDGNNEPGGTDVMRIECSERGGLLLIKRLRILHYSDDVIPWGSVAEDGPVSLGMDMGARVLSRDDCDVIFELVDAGGFWDVVDAKRRRALPKEVEDRLDNLVGWGTPPVLEGIREGFYNLHYDPIQTQKPLRSLEYLYDNLHI